MTMIPHSETPPPPARILVVDDEPATLNLMRAVIRVSGRTFREASDAATALEALWENFRDLELLITNVHTPHLDGLGLARRARELAPSIKVIATSAGTDATERQAMDDLGVAAVLQKPFSAVEMKSCIDAILT